MKNKWNFLAAFGLGALGAVLAIWLVLRYCLPEKEGVVFPMVEISFSLPEPVAEPFAAEFWGWIENKKGDGLWVPAFFDGDGVWKLRYSPRARGGYKVRLFSGSGPDRRPLVPIHLQPSTFEVKGRAAGSGLVRISPEHSQNFIREDGTVYFPVGWNVGWDMGEQGDVVAFLERLGAAGGNWSRIWMCHWDDKNLDWPQGKKLAPGELDLAAARKWDRIVAAADRLQIPFQWVLQHHGQYSSEVNPVWKENPWNQANGGFLAKAEDFFSDPQARLLTQRKYRYVVARYGYSPSIMAWELFNEVEFTDAAKTAEGRLAILSWHGEMAAYLRSLDPWRHLITTSAPSLDDPVWRVTDFYQQHAYPPDPMTGSGGFDAGPLALSKPIFYGEIGSMGEGGFTAGDGGKILRDILWGGIFAGAGATAQYWAWDQADREGMYPLLTALARFAQKAHLGEGLWRPVSASVSTRGKVDLVFGPGQRWASVVDPQVVLPNDGSGLPSGTKFSATLRPRRGSGERVGSDSATFQVSLSQPSRWEVTVNEVSALGARIELEVDGKIVESKIWEANTPEVLLKSLPLVLGVDLPAGSKVLRVKSNGPDYFQISAVRLKNYVPELGVRAMTNDRNTVLWIYRPSGMEGSPLQNPIVPSVKGIVHLTGLLDGNYKMIWWDTAKAQVILEEKKEIAGGEIELATPPVNSDLALLLIREDKAAR